ncbi:phasin family protein [Burkholderia sp. YR290]|nr:phasin family protein [Paraburkholderia hospita]SOE83736.1 phasin family protein [Burkholderia sp. YR290]
MLSDEQIAATQTAYLDNLFRLTNGIVEGVDKLARLNMETIRLTLAGQLDRTQKALAVREPQEWLRLHDRLAAPTAERFQAQNHQLFEIAASIHVAFMRFAQAQWEAYGHGVRTLAEDVAKSAPVGSGSAVAALNFTITATRKLYEILQETGRRAVEVTRGSFDVAAMAVSRTARRTIGPANEATKR